MAHEPSETCSSVRLSNTVYALPSGRSLGGKRQNTDHGGRRVLTGFRLPCIEFNAFSFRKGSVDGRGPEGV